MKVLGPKESAKLIVQSARDVSVHQDGVSRVADLIQDSYHVGAFSIGSWKKHPLHPQKADKKAAEWIFLVDALNFSFWSEQRDVWFEVQFGGQRNSGYWSLCAAINRALQEGIPVWNPEFYRNISRDEVEKIFRTDSEAQMPLLEERHRIMRECGHVLCEEFDGSFINCIAQCNGSCQALLSLVIQHFPSFRDEAFYNGCKVSFYKRAQILIADLWSCFEGEGLGKFDDIDTLTAFADYRVPQVLVHFGAMRYSQQLTDMLRKGEMMENGQREEVEIRGATIHACELVREELQKRARDDPTLSSINAVLVDYFLWDYRRQHVDEMDHVPFHKVRSIYY